MTVSIVHALTARAVALLVELPSCAPDPPPKHHWFPEQYAASPGEPLRVIAAATERRPYSCQLYDAEQWHVLAIATA
jgi:hypothetical protein